MSTISLRLPHSIHERIKALAERDGTSINQFLATAASEKVAALDADEYLDARARRGTRSRFLELAQRAPDAEPEPRDRLPEGTHSMRSPSWIYNPIEQGLAAIKGQTVTLAVRGKVLGEPIFESHFSEDREARIEDVNANFAKFYLIDAARIVAEPLENIVLSEDTKRRRALVLIRPPAKM